MTTYQKPDGSVVIEASAKEAAMLDCAVVHFTANHATDLTLYRWRRLLQDLREREELHPAAQSPLAK